MSTAAWAKMRHRVYVLSYTVYMFHFVCICQNLNYGEGLTWLMYMYRCLRETGLNLDCMHQFYHALLHAYAWDSYIFSGHINIQWKFIAYGPIILILLIYIHRLVYNIFTYTLLSLHAKIWMYILHDVLYMFSQQFFASSKRPFLNSEFALLFSRSTKL